MEGAGRGYKIPAILTRIAVVTVLAMPPAFARTGPEWRDNQPGALPEFPSSGMILAQDQRGEPGSTPGMGNSPGTSGGGYHLALSDTLTNGIVLVLGAASRECGQLPPEFRADCLQVSFRRAARATENSPDYGAAAALLNSASRRISILVSRNADPAAGRSGTRRYRAVKKSAVRAVNSAAAAVVTETETKLLRSAGSSQHRKTHYQRIAQAVGSTKRILRS